MALKTRIQKELRDITNNGLFKMKYIDQKEYIEKLGAPKDIFQRSYFQYKSQMQFFPLYYRIIINVLSVFLTIYYFFKRNSNIDKQSKYDAAFITSGVSKEIISNKLFIDSKNIVECSSTGKTMLSKADKEFIFNELIKKYWYSPYFCLKVIVKVSRYSYIFESHQVSRIITYLEFSFASSILTEYCRRKGIEHINVMHGEKLFNIRDSFVEFDKFYVWDEYYKKMFLDLKASENQFIIELPISITNLHLNPNKMMNNLTYYLGNETKEELATIKNNLKLLIKNYDKITVRYHPRYAEIEEIEKIFKDFNIENPEIVSLEESLNNCTYVVSLYSTVLFQAYVVGKDIIIDDISRPSKYKQLKNYKYIMIDKSHSNLSELI